MKEKKQDSMVFECKFKFDTNWRKISKNVYLQLCKIMNICSRHTEDICNKTEHHDDGLIQLRVCNHTNIRAMKIKYGKD